MSDGLYALKAAETILVYCPTIVTNWNGKREPESTGSALRKVRAAIEALERTRKDAA